MIRRVGLVGGAVALIAGGAFVVTRVVGGGGGSSNGNGDQKWNTVVVLSGEDITLLEEGGAKEVAKFDAGTDLLGVQSLVVDDVLVTLDEAGQLTQTDLGDGSRELARAGRNATLLLSPDNSSVALVATEGGGDVTVIDTTLRSIVSIAEVADLDDPEIFADDLRVNPAATHAAAPVPRLFQSLIVDLEAKTSTALAGRVIAIDNTQVVTEQPAGNQSEIEFYDLAGKRLGSVDVVAPQASMITPDGSMLLVAATGEITLATPDDTDEVSALTDPDGRTIEVTDGTRVAGGERLLAIGDNHVFVIDPKGEQLAVVPGRIAISPTVDSRCLVLATGTATIGVSVLDLETGVVITEVDRGFVTATSADGCTVAVSGGATPRLLADGETTDIDADSITAVAPDGLAFVTVNGRRSELVTIGADDPVNIANGPALIRFAQR